MERKITSTAHKSHEEEQTYGRQRKTVFSSEEMATPSWPVLFVKKTAANHAI
jgi:hypothetical protein